MRERDIEQTLAATGIENAKWETSLLRERFTGKALETAVRRRAAREPLQYILGEWDFWREKYEVNEHCLIPRPDTEILVEKAVNILPNGARFLDLCTGSGCVAISVLATRPDCNAVAVDLFEDTLALAARNAARNGVADRVRFCRADVLTASPADLGGAPFDAILSNPPYIPADVIPTLSPEVQREPRAALCGGADGLDFYRAIVKSWNGALKRGGFFLFEIGFDQANALRALAAENGMSVEVTRDYGGNDRVVLLRGMTNQ